MSAVLIAKFQRMVWYGMVWYGMVWYGMVWYGMVWYGMVFIHSTSVYILHSTDNTGC